MNCTRKRAYRNYKDKLILLGLRQKEGDEEFRRVMGYSSSPSLLEPSSSTNSRSRNYKKNNKSRRSNVSPYRNSSSSNTLNEMGRNVSLDRFADINQLSPSGFHPTNSFLELPKMKKVHSEPNLTAHSYGLHLQCPSPPSFTTNQDHASSAPIQIPIPGPSFHFGGGSVTPLSPHSPDSFVMSPPPSYEQHMHMRHRNQSGLSNVDDFVNEMAPSPNGAGAWGDSSTWEHQILSEFSHMEIGNGGHFNSGCSSMDNLQIQGTNNSSGYNSSERSYANSPVNDGSYPYSNPQFPPFTSSYTHFNGEHLNVYGTGILEENNGENGSWNVIEDNGNRNSQTNITSQQLPDTVSPVVPSIVVNGCPINNSVGLPYTDDFLGAVSTDPFPTDTFSPTTTSNSSSCFQNIETERQSFLPETANDFPPLSYFGLGLEDFV